MIFVGNEYTKTDPSTRGVIVAAWRRRSGAMACDACGQVLDRLALREMYVLSLRGTGHLRPFECSQTEYVLQCPNCGSKDSFQPAVLCAGCAMRPCECQDDSLPPPPTTVGRKQAGDCSDDLANR